MNTLRPYGYLYIVTGRRYIDEAILSAQSLRRTFPEADITLVADQEVNDSVFDEVKVRPYSAKNRREGFQYKALHMYSSSPYKKTFFVDSDTFFVEACQELFDLLEYFDICVALDINDNYRIEVDGNMLEGYFPYNTGVIIFRRSAANEKFFQMWRKQYDTDLHDQPLFMRALLQAEVKIYSMHTIYNARIPGMVSFLPEKVKLIHGRHEDYPAVARKLNWNILNRVWIPLEQVVLVNDKQVVRFKRQSWRHRIFYNLPGPVQTMIKRLLGR